MKIKFDAAAFVADVQAFTAVQAVTHGVTEGEEKAIIQKLEELTVAHKALGDEAQILKPGIEPKDAWVLWDWPFDETPGVEHEEVDE